jgi:GT2 family glycosyltransferase/uncharacterized protein (DUF433 family)
MIKYQKSDQVNASRLKGRAIFNTKQGGKIAADDNIVELWNNAQDKTLDQIIEEYKNINPDLIRAAIACLSEAELLVRKGYTPELKCLEKIEGHLVSAIIITYNSLKWLGEIIPSIYNQTYSPVEIVLVENGSNDGSIEWVEENYPEIKIIRLKNTTSFAAANNIGISSAKGDYIFLVNPDVKVESDAISEMVKLEKKHGDNAIVAAKLKFWWAPPFINGIGNRVGQFSWGTDNCLGYLDLGQFDHWIELPSACFAATLFPKKLFDFTGSIDENFPMYYEDAEWSYRARTKGIRVIPAANAIIYHAFGGKIPGEENDNLTPTKLQNVAYGRYRFVILINNIYLFRFLKNYFIEDCLNIFRLLIKLDIRNINAYFNAWFKVFLDFPVLLDKREQIQNQRIIDDEELYAIQKNMPRTLVWEGLPELTWQLIEDYYFKKIISRKVYLMPEFDNKNRQPHFLIVSIDIIDIKMAGPGMRYLEIAKELSKVMAVTLAIPNSTKLEIPNLRIVQYWEEHPDSLRVLIENSDAALISGYMVEKFKFLPEMENRIIVDLYDPIVLENLHYYLDESINNQRSLNDQAVKVTNDLANLGDFFICGNERQRDYWLGVLTANGRINPQNFIQDSSLRSLIDIVGIGLPKHSPDSTPIMRGIYPNIPANAKIVLWGGGIWNWLDPLTLIKAWPQVIKENPEARLVFLGTRHPNPLVPEHEMASKAIRLAKELGEFEKSIVFFEWVSYKDRERFLSEADISITLHPIHVETRFSLRTRVLDAIWARIPVIITNGDITSEWVNNYHIGEVVNEFDSVSVANAINNLLRKPKTTWQSGFSTLHQLLSWENVIEPLKNYIFEGSIAPDWEEARNRIIDLKEKRIKGRIAKTVYLYRKYGFQITFHRAWRYIQWRLSIAFFKS